MKMKKTQSLKLMLLGLLALTSTGALAKVGDVFDDRTSGLIFEELAGKKAKLVGIADIGGKIITIPSTAENGYDRDKNNDPKVLTVTEVADDWYDAGEIWYVKNGNEKYRFVECPSALDIANLTLVIDATDLKTISTKALQPLNGVIKKFVVNPTAGLTAIPDYAFYNGTFDEEATNANADPAILAQIANLKYQKAIYDYRLDGKEKNAKLTDGSTLYWLVGPDEVSPKDGKYTPVVKSQFPDANGCYDLIDAYTGENYGIKAQDWPGTTALAGYPVTKVVAKPLTREIKGLNDQLADAQDARTAAAQALATDEVSTSDYQTALKEYNDALDAYEAILYVKDQLTNNTTLHNIWINANSAVIDAIASCITTVGIPAEVEALGQTQIDYYTTLRNMLLDDPKWPKVDTGVGYIIYQVGEIQDAEDNLKAALEAVDAEGDDAVPALVAHKQAIDKKAVAEAEIARLQPIIQAQTAARDALANQIAYLEANQLIPVYKPNLDPITGAVVNNTTLRGVALWGGSLTGIGTSAFENCINATFGPGAGPDPTVHSGAGAAGPDSRLPLTTQTIGAKAFMNTKIQPVFVDAANGDLEALVSIGDYAFANPVNRGTIYADFSKNANLKSFGEHVFDNAWTKTLKLKGTAIEKYPDYLAQCLVQSTPKFVDDCGYFYNYDVTNPADVAALTALKFTPQEIGATNDPTDSEYGTRNGGAASVNETLETASLPENIKAIPNYAFMNDIKLATLDGGIPVPVVTIGTQAFFRTKITEFNLANNINLKTIGAQAFAGNSDLVTVTLPQGKDAKLTALEQGVFECDGELTTVTIGENITCLPAGTFKGNNKITTLDLSKTQIEVLYNLFGTGEETDVNAYGGTYKKETVNTTLTSILLPERTISADDNTTVLIPGLKVIMPYALQYMQGLTEVTIPSSVYFMGDGTFYNCNSLKTVRAIDSHLTTFGANTFRNCDNLTDFYFVTLKCIEDENVGLAELIEEYGLKNACGLEDVDDDNDVVVHSFVDDHNFFSSNYVNIHVTKESLKAIADKFNSVNHGYAKLVLYQLTLAMNVGGIDEAATLPYYNSDYATWIDMREADVYTSYQDLVAEGKVKIYMIKAKHNQGYYKIPRASVIIPDGRPGFINWRPSNGVYSFPGYNDTFMDWYVDGPNQDFNYDAWRPYLPSAACIIIEPKNGGLDGIKGSVPYERVSSDEDLMNESTLDPCNQIKITRNPIGPLSSSSNIFLFSHPKAGGADRWTPGPMTEGTIKANSMVLSVDAGRANGNVNGVREFEVVWVDSDLTGIEDVKSYIKSLNDSEAIYNLQGVKVTAPVKGQLYIQGGKKFIQK